MSVKPMTSDQQPVDGLFLLAAAGLLLLGLVMVGSASVAVAERVTGDMNYYFHRQAAYAGIGLTAASLVFLIPLRQWQSNGFLLLGVGLLLLSIVLLPGVGHEVNGARRWIDLGPLNLQVSEPARLFLLIYLASYAVRQQVALQNTLWGVLRPMLPLMLASVLMLVEPDFGAAAILMAVALTLLFLAGAKIWHLGIVVSGACGALVLAALSSPYRVKRLVSFLDPWAHPYESGFQLTQSLIAIGRGEFAGVGLGNSVQKLLYLPETHTDFLFAIYAEELGLIGVLALLGLYGLIVWRGYVIAGRAMAVNRPFAAYLAYALATWLGLQAFINVAVNMGLLPTKGLTLPLMSYGGSSLVVMLVVLALLLRVDHESRRGPPREVRSKREPRL